MMAKVFAQHEVLTCPKSQLQSYSHFIILCVVLPACEIYCIFYCIFESLHCVLIVGLLMRFLIYVFIFSTSVLEKQADFM